LNLTSWCDQILSKHALNAFTEQASAAEFGKLFQLFATHAEIKFYADHSEKYGLEVYRRLTL